MALGEHDADDVRSYAACGRGGTPDNSFHREVASSSAPADPFATSPRATGTLSNRFRFPGECSASIEEASR